MGVDVTSVTTYINPFVENIQPVTVSLTLLEGVVCTTLFSWVFLKKIKASMITENNYLLSVLLGYHYKLEIIITQMSKKSPRIS